MKLKRIAGITLTSLIIFSATACGVSVKNESSKINSSANNTSSTVIPSEASSSNIFSSSSSNASSAISSKASSSSVASSSAVSSKASSSSVTSSSAISSNASSSAIPSSSSSQVAKPEIDTDTINNLNTYINSLMSSTTSYIPSWNQEGFKDRWNYIDGVFLTSIMNLYKSTNDSTYLNFVINYVNYYIDSDGNFVKPQNGGVGYQSGELDSICESRILFDLYEYTKDSRYIAAIETTYNELQNVSITANGYNYSHKNSYLNQIWLDGMYMYVPFLIQYANYKNDSNLKEEINNHLYNAYKYIRDNMFDEEKKIYYHGHDTTKSIFWADSNTGNSASFWLRSNGWLIVSIADALDYVTDNTLKNYLKNMLKEALDGILQYQDNDTKMFYQLIDQGNKTFVVPSKYLSGLGNKAYQVNGKYTDAEIANYLESSGSAMIAYACAKASDHLNDSKYKDIGINIFNGVYNNKFINNSLQDICISAGLGPSSNTIRDGSPQYYLAEKVGADDAKGTGPFIMAYVKLATE